MIGRLALVIGIVFVALGGWLAVQAAARRLAARRPELGPAREDCAGGCARHDCHADETCARRRND